jgi:hypothetical protein
MENNYLLGTPNDPSDDLVLLEKGDFIELMVGTDCGSFRWLCCLADPKIYKAAILMYIRLSDQERTLLLKRVCGCGLPTPALPAQEYPPIQGTPTVYTPPEQAARPPLSQASPPAQPPPPPPVECSKELPPPGAYLEGVS